MPFSQIKKIFRNYNLKKELLGVDREKKFITLNDASSIGILYKVGEENDYIKFVNFVSSLQSSKKDIKTLGYVNYNITPHYCYPKLSYDYFTKKQVSWLGIPKSETVKDFINKEFDLLINLTLDDDFFYKYICSLSRAKCKIGRQTIDNEKCLDFMLKIDDSLNVEEFIEKLTQYWNVF